MILNIALLLVGTTATLAAFGGKTWRDGTKPILQRVTPRGWVSLICLLGALTLGIVKEVTKQQSAERADQSAQAEKAELQKQINDANGELSYLRQNSRHQPTVTAAPVPALRGGQTVPLGMKPYAGSRLEFLGFSCPLRVSIKGSVRREFPVGPMQNLTVPVIGVTGERVPVEIRNLEPSGRSDQSRYCSGKVMVHSVPFIEE